MYMSADIMNPGMGVPRFLESRSSRHGQRVYTLAIAPSICRLDDGPDASIHLAAATMVPKVRSDTSPRSKDVVH